MQVVIVGRLIFRLLVFRVSILADAALLQSSLPLLLIIVS